MIGAIAKVMLSFALDKLHIRPTNLAFSFVSVAGWGIVTVSFAVEIFDRNQTVS